MIKNEFETKKYLELFVEVGTINSNTTILCNIYKSLFISYRSLT